MLKETIGFEDFDGKHVIEDFYFNLTVAELTEWELTTEGGVKAVIDEIIANPQATKVLPLFKELVSKSVGRRVGRRFEKSDEITSDFIHSGAYSTFFMRLLSDAEYAAKFCSGIMPSTEQLEAYVAVEDVQLPAEIPPKKYTTEELLKLTDVEFDQAVGTDPKTWTQQQLVAAMQRRNNRAA